MLQHSSTPHIIPTLHVLKLTHPQITSFGAQAGFCHQTIHQLQVDREERTGKEEMFLNVWLDSLFIWDYLNTK